MGMFFQQRDLMHPGYMLEPEKNNVVQNIAKSKLRIGNRKLQELPDQKLGMRTILLKLQKIDIEKLKDINSKYEQ